RKRKVLDAVSERFFIRKTIDYTHYETSNRFLEGTGSFVLDRDNQVAYAARSPRTDEAWFEAFCKQMGYKPVIFSSVAASGQPIYHTNVMLCVADRYAVINLVSIPRTERDSVQKILESTGKKVVPINHAQMQQFAGNMLQVKNKQ